LTLIIRTIFTTEKHTKKIKIKLKQLSEFASKTQNEKPRNLLKNLKSTFVRTNSDWKQPFIKFSSNKLTKKEIKN
jgi:hypothetical protein